MSSFMAFSVRFDTQNKPEQSQLARSPPRDCELLHISRFIPCRDASRFRRAIGARSRLRARAPVKPRYRQGLIAPEIKRMSTSDHPSYVVAVLNDVRSTPRLTVALCVQ